MKILRLSLSPFFIGLVVTISCAFTSCIQGKIIDKQVRERYGETVVPSKKKQPEYIVVKSSIPVQNDIPSVTTHKTKMLPLLLYWKTEYKNTCILNPQIAINAYTASLTKEANKSLKDKLKNRTIELTLEKIPGSFSLLEKDYFIILIVHWSKVTMQSENTDLDFRVSYRILNNNSEEKKGIITIKTGENKAGLGYFKSLKSATQEYLTQYDYDITTLSKEVIEKISAEL